MSSTLPEIRPIRGHREFLEGLRVRVRVFVDEQGGPESDEPDEWDPSSRHFILLDRPGGPGEVVVGTARLYQPVFGVGKVGRVALLPEYRGRGWGERLIGEVLRYCRTLGLREVVLDAQESAVGFYGQFGFRPEGEPFEDSGIPHRRMRLTLAAPADPSET